MRFRKTLTLLMLAVGLVFALSAWAQQKPLTQDQVQSLVRSGLGDETGAKAIEQRGIDFAPAEDFMQTLKAAGASEAFLKAVRAAKPPEPARAKKPINQVQVITLLASGVPGPRVTMLVQERGLDFEPSQDYLEKVRLAGGDDALIAALKGAAVIKPVAVVQSPKDAAEYVNHAKKLIAVGLLDGAAKELSNALTADEFNAQAHFYLGEVLAQRKDYEKARQEFDAAVNLDPRTITPYMRLASVDILLLNQKHDNDFRIEAIRCLRRAKEISLSVRSDRYSEDKAVAGMTVDADRYLKQLLGISGAWSVPGSTGEWKFLEWDEDDPPPLKATDPRTGLSFTPRIMIFHFATKPLATGYLWRKNDLDFEGWYVTAIDPDLKCAHALHLVSLHESDDGMYLGGTYDVEPPPGKPVRGCTYSGTYQIQLQRENK
jgi:tetratricopeptide (TPR) repeat protein